VKSGSHSLLFVAAGTLIAAPSFAADISIKITLPTIEGNGFRPPSRPYVAIWLRRADNGFAGDLAVWYQIEGHHRREGFGPPGNQPQNSRTPGGARWLNEVREWWADSGNRLQFPVDGLTSASRAAGTYELTFSSSDPKLANLPAGKYQLMVEAAREHGGDETVSIPFEWPVKSNQSGHAAGQQELGPVELALKP